MLSAKALLSFRSFVVCSLALPVLCLLPLGCWHASPAAREVESQQGESSAKKAHPENKTSNSATNGQPKCGDTPLQSTDHAHLAKASVEQLLLSFWLAGGMLGPTDSAPGFRYMDWNDAKSRDAALTDNEAILEELKRRKDVPKGVPLKYRHYNYAIFTGVNGPYCTIANVCAALLHEEDEVMPEF